MFKKLKDWRKKHFPTRWEKLQAYDEARKAYEQTDEYKRISEAYEKNRLQLLLKRPLKRKLQKNELQKNKPKRKS